MNNLPIVVALEQGKYTKWARLLPADSLLTLLRATGQFGEKVSEIRDNVDCAIRTDVDFGHFVHEPQFIPTPGFVNCHGAEARAEFGMELIFRVQSGNPIPDFFGPPDWPLSLQNLGFSREFNAMLCETPNVAWAYELHEVGVFTLLWGIGEYSIRMWDCPPPQFNILGADEQMLNDCLKTFVEVHQERRG